MAIISWRRSSTLLLGFTSSSSSPLVLARKSSSQSNSNCCCCFGFPASSPIFPGVAPRRGRGYFSSSRSSRATAMTASLPSQAASSETTAGSDQDVQCSGGEGKTAAAATTRSFREFLRDRKLQLQAARTASAPSSSSPPHHFVLGNEAGDADSIVSAITLAYVESSSSSSPLFSPKDNYSNLAIDKTPVVSISKRDLTTQRPETALLFRLAGLEGIVDDLVCIDDPDLLLREPSPSSEGGDGLKGVSMAADVTLVDHNRLSDAYNLDDNSRNWRVVEILDHHHDEGEHADTCGAESGRRIVAFEDGRATAASTCTLVAERMRELWTMNPSGGDAETEPTTTTTTKLASAPYPVDVSLLLLGTILLDSVNMSARAGKGTSRDAAAIRDLLDNTPWHKLSSEKSKSVLQISGGEGAGTDKPNTTALFEALQNARFDLDFWKTLSVRDALRLDYKQFSPSQSDVDDSCNSGSSFAGSFGVSTVLMSIDDFLAKDDVAASIENYMNEMGVQFLGLMLTNSVDGTFHRQLILSSIDGFPLSDLVEFLQDQDSLHLTQLERQVTGDDGDLTLQFFEQGNVKASRKQVAPIMMQFFESLNVEQI